MAVEQHNSTTSDFFSTWAATGKGHSMAKGHSELVEGIFRTITPKGKTLLDVGCGIGAALATAQAAGASGMAGIDLSEDMIGIARTHLPDADLMVGTADRLPWPDNTFDLAISVEAMYYFHDPVAGLKEICRVLKPGGHFISAIEYFQENAGSQVWATQLPMQIWCWSERQWQDAFEAAGFKDVQCSRIIRRQFKAETEFQPSDFFPDYDAYLDYVREGALQVFGTKS
ncbi:MAG: class I SAM-dependent methyltransferase [Bacteroidetes bacterium]|nr:MAG: class I SAM-dependent methyltransferase [Bacteroidota bacterium]